MDLLIKYLLFTCLANGLVFGFMFIFSKSYDKALLFLGLFLIAYSSINFEWLFDDLPYLPINFYYAIMPIFYLYVKSIFGQFSTKLLWHLLPALIEFLIFSCFLIVPEWGDQFYTRENKYLILITMVFIPPVFNSIYAVWVLLEIRKSKKLVENSYIIANQNYLRWIQITCILFLLDYGIELAGSIVEFNSNLDQFVFVYDALASSFIVLWVSIFGMKQRILRIHELKQTSSLSDKSHETFSEVTKVQTSANKPDLQEADFRKIQLLIEEAKLYKNDDFNLFALADLVKMSPKVVSKLINHFAQKNFSQFIIEYRINAAKALLTNPEYHRYNLSGIGQEVGFKNKTSFFINFKKVVGVTPLEFRKENNQLEK